MLTNIAEGAGYLNEAAIASPGDTDLQLENIIANLAAAVITVMNMDTELLDEFSTYLETGNDGGNDFSGVLVNIEAAANSVDNILNNADPGTPSYEVASALNDFLAFFTTN